MRSIAKCQSSKSSDTGSLEPYCNISTTSCHEEEGSFSCQCLTGFVDTASTNPGQNATTLNTCADADVGVDCITCAREGAECVRTVITEGVSGGADQYTHECVCGPKKAWDATLGKCVIGSKATVCGFGDPDDIAISPNQTHGYWSSAHDVELECDLGTIETIGKSFARHALPLTA